MHGKKKHFLLPIEKLSLPRGLIQHFKINYFLEYVCERQIKRKMNGLLVLSIFLRHLALENNVLVHPPNYFLSKIKFLEFENFKKFRPFAA